MVDLLILALLAACIVLWRELAKLRARVDLLEGGSEIFRYEVDRSDYEPSRAQAVSARAPAVVVEEAAPPPPSVEPEPSVEREPSVEPAPPPEPVASEPIQSPIDDDDVDEPEPKPRLGFEELFGRRLPIWAGGVTLAVAGFLIVKYSIDSGLLSPVVRMILGLLFGTALIAAAEAALRGEGFVRDPRVRQALSGAGIATFYATILVAANIYHLIGPGTAFLAMALVTAAALGLSLRFGAPSAILGLVGGLAAPALVGAGEPNVPLLSSYLALTVGGLTAVSRQQRWAWLGAGALVGGFGWGIILLLGGAMNASSTLSLGILIVLLAIAFPLILLADRGAVLRLVAGLVGCAQMAALVALGGFAPLHWALFGLISVASVWLSRREESLRHLPSAGLALALMLTIVWIDPDQMLFALVLGGITLIYGGAAVIRLWRADGTLTEAGAIAAIALSVLVVPLLHFYRLDGHYDGQFALLALLGAAIAGGGAMLGWRSDTRQDDWRFALLVAAASALIVAAATLALPVWAIAPAGALVASALLWFAGIARDERIAASAWMFAAVAIGLLLIGVTPAQVDHVMGRAAPADWAQAMRWLVPAGMAIWFARTATWAQRDAVAGPLAVLLVYGTLAQVLPSLLLPLVPAAIVAALALAGRPPQLPAMVTGGLLCLLWAFEPLGLWLSGGLWSLLGDPFLSADAPGPSDVALRLAIPAAAIVIAVRRVEFPRRYTRLAVALAILFATSAAHSLFKHLLAIDSEPRFVALGYAERTLWEAQLAALALLAWQWRQRIATIAPAAAALAHFAWYSLVIHNPLWADQSAGAWLLPAFAIAFIILWATKRATLLPEFDRARDWARIILIPLFALSLLRLAFAGPILSSAPTGQTEDILRSLLGALIAIGFLQYGIRAALRDWRIASLALMLATVAKVFLRDASGLDGLVRVASFAALGFSLIGIGWLYSRYLPDPDGMRR